MTAGKIYPANLPSLAHTSACGERLPAGQLVLRRINAFDHPSAQDQPIDPRTGAVP